MQVIRSWPGLLPVLILILVACAGNGNNPPPQGNPPGSFVLNANLSCSDGQVLVQLTWTASQGADEYTVYLFDEPIATGLTVLGHESVLTGDYPGGPAYRVRASNAKGTMDSNTAVMSVPDCDGTAPTAGKPVAVATGQNHVLVVTDTGQVLSWGMNFHGSLGRPGHESIGLPQLVPGLEDVVAVAAGTTWSLALDSQGNLFSWGSNFFGQLGTGDTLHQSTPQRVAALQEPVQAIAVGFAHSLALTEDGRVYAWGNNNVGQLGQGTSSLGPNPDPVQVQGLGAVAGIASGLNHVIVLRGDTTVAGWGSNVQGQLGLGSTGFDPVAPVVIPEFEGIAQVAAAENHSFALKDDHTVYSWGSNENGALGLGEIPLGVSYPAPTQLTIPVDISSIHAGGEQAFALSDAGSWWAWGANETGQLGNGSMINTYSPEASPATVEFASLSTGFSSTTAIDAEGNLYAWGNGQLGMLGSPATDKELDPQEVSGIGQVLHVSASHVHSLAVTTDGQVWAWGLNTSGQLGTGDLLPRFVPTRVEGIKNAIAVAAGGAHSLALLTDNTVVAWGLNEDGQLGVGDEGDRLEPTAVLNLTGVLGITAGVNHSLAYDADGGIWAWGDNDYDKLGNPVIDSSDEPFLVETLPGISGLVTGESHTLAFTPTGARAWGYGWNGQLGIGGVQAEGGSNVPVDVLVLEAPTAMAVADSTSFAVQAGMVWVWGSNAQAQHGDGSDTGETSVPAPQPDSPLSDVVDIAAGEEHALALLEDGSVHGWGSNYFGQLGIGTTERVTSPQPILVGVKEVVAGRGHSFAIRADGSLLAWGYNRNGQLGLGTAGFVLEPQPVDY